MAGCGRGKGEGPFVTNFTFSEPLLPTRVAAKLTLVPKPKLLQKWQFLKAKSAQIWALLTEDSRNKSYKGDGQNWTETAFD